MRRANPIGLDTNTHLAPLQGEPPLAYTVRMSNPGDGVANTGVRSAPSAKVEDYLQSMYSLETEGERVISAYRHTSPADRPNYLALVRFADTALQ